MKKSLLIIAATILVASTSCTSSNEESKKSATIDYSAPECWVQTGKEINPNFADVVWFSGTLFYDQKDAEGNDIHRIFLTDEQKEVFSKMTINSAYDMLFPDSLNFFAPYFHQFTLDLIDKPAEFLDSVYNSVADEAYAIFHCYMEKMNNGRPYILAGMSQGGMMVRGILKRMTDEEFSKMKAAYSFGFGLSEEDLQCKHIVPATGQYDKGVTISYNSVGDVDGIWSIVHNNAVTCINPVNWKTDSTAAEFEYDGMKLTAHIDPTYNLIFVDGFDHDKYPKHEALRKYSWIRTNLHGYDIPLYAPFVRQNALDRAYR